MENGPGNRVVALRQAEWEEADMPNRNHLEHKREEVLYEMNAVRKYIEAHEYDDQLKQAWDQDEHKLHKLEHIIEKIDVREHKTPKSE